MASDTKLNSISCPTVLLSVNGLQPIHTNWFTEIYPIELSNDSSWVSFKHELTPAKYSYTSYASQPVRLRVEHTEEDSNDTHDIDQKSDHTLTQVQLLPIALSTALVASWSRSLTDQTLLDSCLWLRSVLEEAKYVYMPTSVVHTKVLLNTDFKLNSVLCFQYKDVKTGMLTEYWFLKVLPNGYLHKIGLHAIYTVLSLDTICMISYPGTFVSSSRWESSTTCCGCERPSKSLKRCFGCKSVHYCSKECQAKHWTDQHKHECVSLALPNESARRKMALDHVSDPKFTHIRSTICQCIQNHCRDLPLVLVDLIWEYYCDRLQPGGIHRYPMMDRDYTLNVPSFTISASIRDKTALTLYGRATISTIISNRSEHSISILKQLLIREPSMSQSDMTVTVNQRLEHVRHTRRILVTIPGSNTLLLCVYDPDSNQLLFVEIDPDHAVQAVTLDILSIQHLLEDIGDVGLYSFRDVCVDPLDPSIVYIVFQQRSAKVYWFRFRWTVGSSLKHERIKTSPGRVMNFDFCAVDTYSATVCHLGNLRVARSAFNDLSLFSNDPANNEDFKSWMHCHALDGKFTLKYEKSEWKAAEYLIYLPHLQQLWAQNTNGSELDTLIRVYDISKPTVGPQQTFDLELTYSYHFRHAGYENRNVRLIRYGNVLAVFVGDQLIDILYPLI